MNEPLIKSGQGRTDDQAEIRADQVLWASGLGLLCFAVAVVIRAYDKTKMAISSTGRARRF